MKLINFIGFLLKIDKNSSTQAIPCAQLNSLSTGKENVPAINRPKNDRDKIRRTLFQQCTAPIDLPAQNK
jgi:hypothetical protein